MWVEPLTDEQRAELMKAATERMVEMVRKQCARKTNGKTPSEFDSLTRY
jgi:hypothetical protein